MKIYLHPFSNPATFFRCFLALFLTFFTFFVNAQYNAERVTLYSNWADTAAVPLGTSDIKYSSVWGFARDGREYAVLGGTSGTYIIEVTDPANPVLRDFIAGRRGQTIWREYKTYGDYLYMVSDDPSPNSLQIADISYLPDSAHLVYDSDTLFSRAHTIFIDGDKLYAGIPKKNFTGYSMAVYTLANPLQPAFLRSLNQDYPFIDMVHDMFVRNDTVYASCGNQGLYIFTLQADTSFLMIGSLTSYPDKGYNHSSWLTDNGKTMVFCDETPNTAVKIIDVSDVADIIVADTVKSNEGAMAHNPYILGNTHAVVASYEDGVQIYDITTPGSTVRTGFFDTYPQNDTPFVSKGSGTWGAFPFLPSGVLLASDRQNGLFVLNAEAALKRAADTAEVLPPPVGIHPNPFKNTISLGFESGINGELIIELFDVQGKKAWQQTIEGAGNSYFFLNSLDKLPTGVYIISIRGPAFHLHKKMIKGPEDNRK